MLCLLHFYYKPPLQIGIVVVGVDVAGDGGVAVAAALVLSSRIARSLARYVRTIVYYGC